MTLGSAEIVLSLGPAKWEGAMRPIAPLAGAVVIVLFAVLVSPAVLRAGPGLPEEQKPKPRAESKETPTAFIPQKVVPSATSSATTFQVETKRLRAAEVAPRDAVLYAVVPDVTRLKTSLEDLAITKILREEPIETRLNAAIAAFRDKVGESSSSSLLDLIRMFLAIDVDYEPVRNAFRKELALIGLRPKEGSGARLALVATVGAERRPLTEFVDTLMGEMQIRYTQFSSSQREYRGENIRTLESPSIQVSCAYFENLFIVGTGRGTVAELMDTYIAGRERQLAGDPAFKAAEEEIGKGADLFYKVDLDQLAPFLASVVAGQGPSIGSGVMWGAIYLDGPGIRERMEVRASKGSKASPIVPAEPLASPPRSVQYFPIDTVFFMAMSVEPSKALTDALADARVGQGLAATLAAASSATGIKFEPDLFAAFGGELALGVVVPPGRPAEFLAVLEVRKPDAMGRLLDALEQAVGQGRFKAVTYREHKIRYAEPQTQKLAKESLADKLFPSPAYARTPAGDFLIVASSRRALEKAIRQQEHKRSSLLDKPDFTRCMGKLRARRTGIFYLDAERLFRFLGTRIPFENGEFAEGPLMAARSEVGALIPHLFGVGIVSDGSASLSIQESWGPLGPLSGAGLASLLALGGAGAEDDTEALKLDRAKLQRIGSALHLYATDFDRFPSALSELYAPQYLQDRSAFEAPGGRQAIKTKDDIDTKSDYIYVKGLTPADLSDKIIVYSDRVMYSSGVRGRNVLFVNGRVEFLPESSFKMMMERQKAATRP